MEQSQPEQKSRIRYIALLLAFVSLFPLIFGGYPLVKQIALDLIGVRTTGTVVEVSGFEATAPIVQFTTSDGEQIEFKSYYASNTIVFSVGEDVQVLYLAGNPRIAEVSLSGRLNYPSNAGTTCLGIILLLGGLIALMNRPIVLDLRRKQ